MHDAKKATGTWVSSAAKLARERGLEQVDLDDLLDGEPESAVRVGLACVRMASRMLSPDDGARLRVFLAVPLAPTTRLELAPPDMLRLLDEPWLYGPGRSVPGLYIARLDSLHWDRVAEEYRREIPVLLTGWYAEYRTWRTPEQAAAGWEYDRATYFWVDDSTS